MNSRQIAQPHERHWCIWREFFYFARFSEIVWINFFSSNLLWLTYLKNRQ